MKSFRVILEINGDYWHANSLKYRETDILKFPDGEFTAKSIWEKDAEKKKIAEKFGFKVLVIWEHEINKISDDELAVLLLGKLEVLLNEEGKN